MCLFAGSSITGYDLVLQSLSAQTRDLFLGRVEMNYFRRNTALEPIVLQVQNGVPEVSGCNSFECAERNV